jgi:hypothetical protein
VLAEIASILERNLPVDESRSEPPLTQNLGVKSLNGQHTSQFVFDSEVETMEWANQDRGSSLDFPILLGENRRASGGKGQDQEN